ncbi:MAG: hypothetical protein J1F01_08040 [Oscillospiraceae bacterium]|nr:hypothetical protein [Oscillospiraceae bacterium]
MKKKSVVSLSLIFILIFCAVNANAENDIEAPEFKDDIITFAANEIIEVNHNNTISEIIATERKLAHTAFTSNMQTRYEVEPNFTAPYSAGSLNQSDIDDAANVLKMVRYLAGVPYENSDFLPELNDISQHGAVLLASSNQFDHYPYKPDDMTDEFYDIAYQGCSRANISAGRDNISACVLGWIYDAGANNIARAGHRRWILKPGNQDFGIGYAQGPSASYRGHRANMYVFGKTSYRTDFDSYVAWPAAGDFPIQYMAGSSYIKDTIDCPWSLNLGAPYAVPDKDRITLKLTRKRDGKVWVFDKNTPDLGEEGLSDSKMHLAVDNGGYGIGKAIVFRPDPNSLGSINDGDVFNIELSGIEYTDGTETVLSYDIRFFDIEKEKNRSTVTIEALSNGAPLKNAAVEINGESVLTDESGIARIRVNNNKSYTYTVSKNGYNTEIGTIAVEQDDIEKRIDMIKTVEVGIDSPFNAYIYGVNISNNGITDKNNIKIYAALYDNNNVLTKITNDNITIQSKEAIQSLIMISMDDYTRADRVCLFIWDGMEPLCETQILK